MSEHKPSIAFYLGIFATLVILTVVTAAVAVINLGPFNPIIALGIATTKALLVALFFMHVYGSSERMTKVVIVSALFFLMLLLTLSLADFSTRLWS
jgi:cytochrome c oxidase subunit IV